MHHESVRMVNCLTRHCFDNDVDNQLGNCVPTATARTEDRAHPCKPSWAWSRPICIKSPRSGIIILL